MQRDAVRPRLESNPEVARLGVPSGVGDDLLHATKQNLGARRVVDGERVGQIEMNGDARLLGGQRTNGLREIELTRLTQPAHDVAHVAEQQSG